MKILRTPDERFAHLVDNDRQRVMFTIVGVKIVLLDQRNEVAPAEDSLANTRDALFDLTVRRRINEVSG